MVQNGIVQTVFLCYCAQAIHDRIGRHKSEQTEAAILDRTLARIVRLHQTAQKVLMRTEPRPNSHEPGEPIYTLIDVNEIGYAPTLHVPFHIERLGDVHTDRAIPSPDTEIGGGRLDSTH